VPVYPDTVDFQFSGTVTNVPLDEVFGDIQFGEALHGTLSFDSTAADQIPLDPTVGAYLWTAPFGMDVQIGTHDFKANGALNIEIVQSFVDQFTALATSPDDSLIMQMFLLDIAGTALGDDHLSSPNLASFAERDFQLDDVVGAGQIEVLGQLDAQPTAEPSQVIPLIMMSLAIAALALHRRRYRLLERLKLMPGVDRQAGLHTIKSVASKQVG